MKAQVSLEYLSTYSWAIIILLTIVSVLSYFGFFNQNALIQTTCDSGSFLICEDSELIINSGNPTISDINFKLRNNMKDDIIISRKLELIDWIVPLCNNWENVVIPRGEIVDLGPCIIAAEFEEGDIEDLSFVLWYRRNIPGSQEHFINGALKTQVKA